MPERAPERGGEVGESRPVGRGLERVDGVPGVPQRVPQVRGGEPAVAPRRTDARPGDAPRASNQVVDGLRRRPDDTRIAGEPDDREAALGAHAAEPEVAPEDAGGAALTGEGERRRGLERRRDADHRERQAGSCQAPGQEQSAVPVRDEVAAEPFELRRRAGPDGDVGQDAEPSLGAEDELAEIGAGGRGGVGRQVERPARRFEVAAREQVLDPTEPARLLSGRAGHDPATDGGRLERLREVAERHAVRRKCLFDGRTRRPGTERREAAGLVHRVEAGHRAKIHGHERSVRRPCGHPTDDARPAAVRCQARAGPVAERDECPDRLGVGGTRDGIRHRAQAAGAQRDPVREALPAGVTDPRPRVVVQGWVRGQP